MLNRWTGVILVLGLGVALGLSSVRPVRAAFLCCQPPSSGTMITRPCQPFSAPCNFDCQTRTGLWSGGCQSNAYPWSTCSEFYTQVTHVRTTWPCQGFMGTCPCPPVGGEPYLSENVTTLINDCTGTSC